MIFSQNIMIIVRSGGATGADSAWYDYFKDKEVDFRVMSFPRMNIHHSLDNCKVEIEQPHTVQWKHAIDAVKEAAKCLDTKYRFSPYLVRDFFQIKDAEAVYAIGKKNPSRKGVGIDGGTGYTCQMYANRLKSSNLFLYNMDTLSWECWHPRNGWLPLVIPPLPIAYNVVACIGSREFNHVIPL